MENQMENENGNWACAGVCRPILWPGFLVYYGGTGHCTSNGPQNGMVII